MCDQDHFDDDLKEFETRGLVTRRQFGVLLGAGVAMLLPQVANAVSVTESDVTITTPDGTADCYFVHPASGTAPGVLVWPDIFGLRPAFRADGQAARRDRATRCWWSTRSIASRRRRPLTGRGDPDPLAAAARAGAERDDAHDRREGVHRVAGSAAVGGQEPEDRHAGLLHGRPDGVPHRRPRCPIASARLPRSTAAGS